MRIDVREEEFELLPERALFWPSRGLLAVADFHLGKAETFQQHGLCLPSASHRTDLATLNRLVAGRPVRQLVFLGDLVHSMAGVTPRVIDAFARWMDSFEGEVVVVLGNHDAGLAKRWPKAWERARRCSDVRLGDFVFQHEPVSRAGPGGEFYWVGHVHPMIRLRRGPDRVRLPGFVVSEFQGLLPAFSTNSGGYDVPTACRDRVFVSGGGRVYEV